MGFFTGLLLGFFNISQTLVAIPFRVGWGFSPRELRAGYIGRFESQSLSGWDGVFHRRFCPPFSASRSRRNPFQGGMGFFTLFEICLSAPATSVVAIPFRVGWGFSLKVYLRSEKNQIKSQSLSGWDGVFHGKNAFITWMKENVSQSLSGWDGVFHHVEVRN
jgi:hypothetical protein